MTALQRTVIGATLAVAVGVALLEAHQASRLRRQIHQLQQREAEAIQKLQQERDDVLKQLAALSTKPTPHLPRPPVQVASATNLPVKNLPATNPYVRYLTNEPSLTAEQVQAYLKANRTNVSSLLAAYRTSRDKTLLKEAMKKYPNDPQVAFEAILGGDLSPEEQRQWLNNFEKDAPDNALANYLSAYNYFNSGEIEQGIQQLTAASGKGISDYSVERSLNDEEAYLSAGYSAADAATLANSSLTLPQLSQLKHVGKDLVELANACQQAGDQSSAQAAYQMAMELGQRYQSPSTDWTLISQLVGMAIQKVALGAMDPNSPYGDSGQTVQDQLNQIDQKRTVIRELAPRATALLPTLSDQDILSYENRRRAFGELAAMQWVVNKFGQQ